MAGKKKNSKLRVKGKISVNSKKTGFSAFVSEVQMLPGRFLEKIRAKKKK